ncbi:efflux RND transporter periplasmic adaptor subunit [Litoribrevibacter albus]|uniref:MexH family multidrug efflux RND transporter periplasmic adaptor subunit n=1 Tax=Litoribrevibacter albus TaxID=1473156 RepID=A0AA37SCI7_9GAMM|nr:efflux RND transporter periplasmic adaptor subunit [Litoribrevibacter albus]GLQ32149.1 MexH family multidrug efflux RND transporter periplasmic adaptor subunit [Litoribrevibacter albus]
MTASTSLTFYSYRLFQSQVRSAKWCIGFALLLMATLLQANTPPPAKVVVTVVSSQELADTTSIPGIIDFNTSSLITSEQTGIISEIYFNEGDKVKKGQIIARLNTDLLQQDIKVKGSEIDALKAEQARIEKDIERSNKLLKTSFESKRALENLEFSLKANLANRQRLLHQVERLNILIRKSEIKAQFDGLILAKHKHPGEWLGQADPIVTLAKLSDTIALVSVPERYLRYVHLGSNTSVMIPALDMEVEGVLDSTVPVADLRTKSVPLKVKIDYQPSFIRNMSVKVSVATSDKRKALTLPRDALVQHQGKEFVYTVKTNDDGSQQAQIVPVDISGRYGEIVAIRPGLLKAGSRVVIKGNDRLRPDQPIVIQK